MKNDADDRRTLRVASVQFESAPGDKAANFRKVEAFVERAAGQNVRLIVFPECCLTGYWFIRNLPVEALSHMAGSDAILAVAALFKRVKNISKGVVAAPDLAASTAALHEPSEVALRDAVAAHTPTIRAAAEQGDYKRAFSTVAAMGPVVAKFFDDVMVMAEDEGLRAARLQLVATLRDVILGIADLSEMAAEA